MDDGGCFSLTDVGLCHSVRGRVGTVNDPKLLQGQEHGRGRYFASLGPPHTWTVGAAAEQLDIRVVVNADARNSRPIFQVSVSSWHRMGLADAWSSFRQSPPSERIFCCGMSRLVEMIFSGCSPRSHQEREMTP
jgi:hypothetical protein